MHHSSKNIEKLHYLFTFPKYSENSTAYLTDFDKHLKSKVLAILLANADLATPELNRETVKALLKGKIGWPQLDGSTSKINVDIELEVFENLGALSFYSDYCNVHSRDIQDESNLCESTKPFYNALKKLKQILYGQNFVKSHFQIPKSQAEKLLLDKAYCIDLNTIPELVDHDNVYQISLTHKNDKLLPEYLWQEMNPSDNNLEMLKKWVLITRVYSDCALWHIDLNHLDDQSKSLFLQHILYIIEHDSQLMKSQNILKNQMLCREYFYDMLFHVDHSISMTIDLSSGTSKMESPNHHPEPRTLDDVLTKFIKRESVPIISNIEYIRSCDDYDNPYSSSGLLCFYNFCEKIADDIIISSNTVYRYEKLDQLILLSNERPILRHILLCVLPQFCGIKHLLYLLRDIKNTSTAVYLFTKNIQLVKHIPNIKTDESIHHTYFPIVCDEFLDIGLNNHNHQIPTHDIVELVISLAKDSVNDISNGESKIDKDCLDILLDRFSIEHISYFSNDLIAQINTDNTHERNRLPAWKFYLAFWLLEKCQTFGIFAETELAEKIQSVIIDCYINAFNDNMDSSEHIFEACPIFDHLPWWRINQHHLENLLNLIPNPALWVQKLDSTHSKGHNNKRLARSYFHLLLCLYSKKQSDSRKNQVELKIMRMLETCAFFNEPKRYVGMFEFEDNFNYQLLKKFSFIVDDVSNENFNRIVEVLKSIAPLNQVLVIYYTVNKKSRKKVLLECIRPDLDKKIDQLGLGDIEEALNIAMNTRQLTLANNLLKKGLSIINGDRFSKTSQRSQYFFQHQKIWVSFEYKVKLLNIANNEDLSTEQKISSMNKINEPFKRENHHFLGSLYKSCDGFRREMIAILFFYDNNPEKAYDYFDYLYKESKDFHYSGNRLGAKLAVLENDNDVENYQHALSEWLETIEYVDIQEIKSTFIQNWMYCLYKMDHHKSIDELWGKLSEQQMSNIEIATCYCRSLKDRMKNDSAILIFEDLKKYHNEKKLDDDSEKLLNELKNYIANGHEPTTKSALSKNIEENKKIKPSIFLCYASEDKKIVEKLYEKLKDSRYQLWFDKSDILPGQKWEDEIKKAIEEADMILVCLSEKSVRKRGYVNKEIKMALDRNDEMLKDDIFLIPLILGPCEIPDCLQKFHCADPFQEDDFQRLEQSIDTQLKRLSADS